MLRNMFRVLSMFIVGFLVCYTTQASALDCSTWPLSGSVLFEKKFSYIGDEIIPGWNQTYTSFGPLQNQVFDATNNRVWTACQESSPVNFNTNLSRRTWVSTSGATLNCTVGYLPVLYSQFGNIMKVNNTTGQGNPIIVFPMGAPFVNQPASANQVVMRSWSYAAATAQNICTTGASISNTLPNPIVGAGSNMTYTSDGLYIDPIVPVYDPLNYFASLGRLVALGHSINTCTGICPFPNPRFKTYLQRTQVDQYTGYPNDTVFNSMFLTDRDTLPFGQSLPVSEKAHTLTVLTDNSQLGLPHTGAGYLLAGEAEFKSTQIGGRNGTSLMIMRVADSGSLKVVNGGLLAWPLINPLLSSDGDTGVFNSIKVSKILRKGTAGGFYVVGTVADSAAATPFLRAPRGFVVAFNSNGTFDTAFGTNGLVLIDNALATDKALVVDAVVLAGGSLTILMQDPIGVVSGSIRTQRFFATGAVDTTWGTNGVRLLPITGCTHPVIDNMSIITDASNNIYIGGGAHRY